MNVVDVNVLIALFVNDHPQHPRASSWWSSTGADNLVIPDLVWVGFLRIATNPRVFAAAPTFEDAWLFVDAVLASGRVRVAPSGKAVLREAARLATTTNVRGDLVTDIYIAAVATSLGATVVTFDRDFRKFDGVRIFEPPVVS